MRILTDEDLAMEQLISMVQGNTAPVLEVDELQRCLDDARLAFIWTAAENFGTAPRGLGVSVIPSLTKRNGHRYKLAFFDGTGTTSGATEPSWSTSRDSQFTDGNLTWQESGCEYASLWDLVAAARAAWLLKASKAVTCTDFQQDGVSFSASQVYDHCISQANQYTSIWVA